MNTALVDQKGATMTASVIRLPGTCNARASRWFCCCCGSRTICWEKHGDGSVSRVSLGSHICSARTYSREPKCTTQARVCSQHHHSSGPELHQQNEWWSWKGSPEPQYSGFGVSKV